MIVLFLLAAASLEGQVLTLDGVGRVAEVMVDGDVAKRIETPRSAGMMLKKDSRDPWRASDNYDVDHGAFIQTKKTLMRLGQLCPEICDVNLWMPVGADKKHVQILIRTVNEMSQFWKWGDLYQAMPVEMKEVLETGKRASVRKRPGMVSVLAPVRDSLGDVVGLVEVVSAANRDPRENVK